MKTRQVQIRNMNDLRRYKLYLHKKLQVRRKVLDIRLRRVERKLTVPNVTKELFRDTQWDTILPPLANYLVSKISGESVIGLIAGIAASLGSLKLFTNKRDGGKKVKKIKIQEDEEEQLFI